MLIISLVGEQPLPVLIPLLQKPKAYGEFLLVATSFVKGVAQNITNVLHSDTRFSHLKIHEPLIASAYNMQITRDAILQVLDRCSHKETPVVINLTGGTKIMSLSAQQAAFAMEIPLIYVSSEKNEIIYFNAKSMELRREKIKVKISVRQYLEVYGLEVSDNQAFDPARGPTIAPLKEGDELESEVFARVSSSEKFDDVTHKTYIRKLTKAGEVKNELDVVATRNGRLVVCSCKDVKDLTNDHIYELSSLSRREQAGIYCGKVLVLGHKTRPTQAFIDRARSSSIELVFGDEIEHVVDHFLSASK